MQNYFEVSGLWCARPEDCDTVARRFAEFLANLSEIDPLFTHWLRADLRHRSKVPLRVTLPRRWASCATGSRKIPFRRRGIGGNSISAFRSMPIRRSRSGLLRLFGCVRTWPTRLALGRARRLSFSCSPQATCRISFTSSGKPCWRSPMRGTSIGPGSQPAISAHGNIRPASRFRDTGLAGWFISTSNMPIASTRRETFAWKQSPMALSY